MGGAGDPPAPVRDPPTGTAASNVVKRPCPLAQTVAPEPSGESPDGTGGSPVLPETILFSQSSRERRMGVSQVGVDAFGAAIQCVLRRAQLDTATGALASGPARSA